MRPSVIGGCVWTRTWSAATAGSGNRSTDNVPSFSGTPSTAAASFSARARKSSVRSHHCSASATPASNSRPSTAATANPFNHLLMGLMTRSVATDSPVQEFFHSR